MDLPCLQWQDHVAQKWIGLETEQREQFISFEEIDDVFNYTRALITQDDLDVVLSLAADHSVQKDKDQAAKCRERGNSSFKSRDYTTALLHYSQGVCSAPPSSEQLSLCYANRSAALFYLQHYQESINDMDKALSQGYPSHLSHKLEQRRTQCLKHLSLGVDAKKEHPNLALKPNIEGNLTCRTFGICSQAAVGFSPEKGRHLVATERIAAGDVILSDRPYSCVLIPGMKEVKGKGAKQGTDGGELFGIEQRRCHRCLAETLCPLPCDGCSYSRYCSASCQQEAWEEHHRWECPLGAELMVMGGMLQLALRVALKAGQENIQTARKLIRDERASSKCSSQSSFQTPGHGDSYLSVFHLLHHMNQHSPQLRFLCAVTVATLSLKLCLAVPSLASRDSSEPLGDGALELRILGSAVLRHLLQLRCNAQAVIMLQDTGSGNALVQANQEIRIATAMFPNLSLLNHSCCPNTSLTFSTGTITVRAAKVISAGQEILHCYGPHSRRMTTSERQRLLQEQYFFLCQCEACSLQREPLGQDPRSGLLCEKCKGEFEKSHEDTGIKFTCVQADCRHSVSSAEVSCRLQEIKDDLEKALRLMESERPDQALRLLRRTQCQSGTILAETHPLQGELADAMARAYATMGDWKKASFLLERSALATASQYGEDSIELGHQLFKLAQLHFNGGARGPALSVISKVRRLLCLHLGPQCQELQELRAMEDCL
uniref:Protein-lysine N-methyltransferase SMYD4 n=1 Tax=Tetraodon nigroviridis TaxID=99883 RepID=H3DFG5_TETNG